MSNKPNKIRKLEKPKPSPIKEEYKFIPKKKWVPLDPVLPKELHGRYLANLAGEIKNIKTGKIWTLKTYKVDKRGYQRIWLSNSKLKFKKTYKVYRLLALLFLHNDDPVNKTFVDHIDRNPSNSKLSNLRWVTPSENNKNKSERRKRFIIRASTLDFNLISEEDFRYISKSMKAKIASAIKSNNGIIGDKFYQKIDLILEEYIYTYGLPDPYGWKKTGYKNLWVNTKGFFKDEKDNLLIGSIDAFGYRIIKANGIYKRCHIIICETFLNNCKSFKKGIEIDHLDTNPGNNTLWNLKPGTKSDNMSNPKTKRKTEKAVVRFNSETLKKIDEFKSITIAVKETGTSNTSIRKSCNGDRNLGNGYIWAWKGEEEERLRRFKNSSKKVIKPSGYWNIKENCRLESLKYRGRGEFCNNSYQAYQSSLDHGWLDEFFPIKRIKHTTIYADKEVCRKEALRFETKSKFAKGKPGAYQRACEFGWIDEFFPEIERFCCIYSNKEICRKASTKFKKRSKFKSGNHLAYDYAKNNGWLDEFFPSKGK